MCNISVSPSSMNVYYTIPDVPDILGCLKNMW
jgi:hypothetical protein